MFARTNNANVVSTPTVEELRLRIYLGWIVTAGSDRMFWHGIDYFKSDVGNVLCTVLREVQCHSLVLILNNVESDIHNVFFIGESGVNLIREKILICLCQDFSRKNFHRRRKCL